MFGNYGIWALKCKDSKNNALFLTKELKKLQKIHAKETTGNETEVKNTI